jgi:hypothetical protein
MTVTAPEVQDIGISDEEVTRILDQIEPDERVRQVEQRRSQRSYLRGTVVFVVVLKGLHPPAVLYRARLRNVSFHGVSFLTCGPMAPGTRLRMELPVGADLDTVEKHAIVRRCRHIERMIYEIGAEFEGDCGR